MEFEENFEINNIKSKYLNHILTCYRINLWKVYFLTIFNKKANNSKDTISVSLVMKESKHFIYLKKKFFSSYNRLLFLFFFF